LGRQRNTITIAAIRHRIIVAAMLDRLEATVPQQQGAI